MGLFGKLVKELIPDKAKKYLSKLLESSDDSNVYSSFTPDIGNDICACLNTVGGEVLIRKNDWVDDAARESYYEGKLNELYSSFNLNPSEWVSLMIPEKAEMEYVIISIIASNNGEIYRYNGNAYYKENNKIKIANNDSEIIKNRKISKGQPLLEKYEPSNDEKNKDFIKVSKDNNVNYFRIGVLPQNRATFYKYFTLDTALSILRKEESPKGKKIDGMRNPPQTLQFVEPLAWGDQYERRFYLANYKKVNMAPGNTPQLFATCFTHRRESEPAWQIYNRGKEGLGKRCVQFCFNQVALRMELVKNLRDCMIVEGVVQYLSNSMIDTLHLSTKEDGSDNKTYDQYFYDFSLDNFINLLLLKRTAFEHEQEVRIFIIDEKSGRRSKTKNKAQQRLISLDWLSMLESIKVDPECSDIEINLLQDEINRLIEDSKNTKKKKKELFKKLTVSRYDVNSDIEKDESLPIGETYKQYNNRLSKLQSKK